jgi:hypothetical protein
MELFRKAEKLQDYWIFCIQIALTGISVPLSFLFIYYYFLLFLILFYFHCLEYLSSIYTLI